jgi:predicted aconitase with swiveling domain
MAETIKLKGRKVIGGVTEGEALVSPMPLMGWGNINVPSGYTVERNHPLYEVPLKDKILVFPYARGSGGFMSYGMTSKYGVGPAAMLYNQGMSITVFAGMNLGKPTMTDFGDDVDLTKVIATGDYVVVNADEGFIEVYKGGKPK